MKISGTLFRGCPTNPWQNSKSRRFVERLQNSSLALQQADDSNFSAISIKEEPT